MSPYFEEDWVPDEVVLEVSSPGVYRVLNSKKHFEAVLDQVISCVITGGLSEAVMKEAPKSVKNGKDLRGKLKTIKEESILLEIEGYELELSFAQIKSAQLDPDL
jgi:ribosome maturation factor RimP